MLGRALDAAILDLTNYQPGPFTNPARTGQSAMYRDFAYIARRSLRLAHGARTVEISLSRTGKIHAADLPPH